MSRRRRILGGSLEAMLEELPQRRPRTLARLVSLVEDDPQLQPAIVAYAYPRTGHARVVGFTGPPGAGKSTLVDRVARACRARGETVAILAVDPSSPYSGGALLGDRIRMQALDTDPGVFIRSMATRGALGGLARASRDAIDVLDAAGFDWVLVETVGVGQDEVDVVRSVDTVVVVTVPGLGDEIQAIKAGILEIADVFVVNKADRDGADRTVRDLEMLLGMLQDLPWTPPIRRTVAARGEGVEELLGAILEHDRWLETSGERTRRRQAQLRLRVESLLEARILAAADRAVGLERAVEQGFSRREDPYRVADRLFAGVVAAGPAIATVASNGREDER